MLHVLLSLDFVNAEDQRADFYKYLEGKYWKKQAGVDTVWTITYPLKDQSGFSDVASNISEILLAGAEGYKPDEMTYVAQIGNAEAIARIVKKKHGTYGVFAL